MNKRYNEFMSTVKATESAVEKAVDCMYHSDTTATSEYKPKRRGYFSVVATAAVLCLVLLAGFMFYPFGKGAENVFVISAGAAELNSYELVKLGELNCESNSQGICINEDNQVTSITMCKWLDFPINCSGETIESVTYKINGKGFFALPVSATNICDRVIFENSAEIAPYDMIHLQGVNETYDYKEKLTSFTADYLYQNQGAQLCLYISESEGTYCLEYNSTFVDTEVGIAHGKGFDYQQMYYDLFSAGDYSIEITAKFNDGTTQTKTVNLVIEKADKEIYSEQGTTLTVSAKLAE